jgi:hypothetical protein
VLVGNTVSVGSTSNFTQGVCCCMATRLVHWSQEEICAVIRFLHARHVSAAEVHRQLVEVYGDEAMSRQSVANWCSDFKSRRIGQRLVREVAD